MRTLSTGRPLYKNVGRGHEYILKYEVFFLRGSRGLIFIYASQVISPTFPYYTPLISLLLQYLLNFTINNHNYNNITL
jgi:hypothetical protein